MSLIFAGHEIDLRRQELRRSGNIVHVEPQVYRPAGPPGTKSRSRRQQGRIAGHDLERTDCIGSSVEQPDQRRTQGNRDDGDGQKLIKTIHRRGFRFIGTARDTADEPTEALPLPAVGQNDPASGNLDGVASPVKFGVSSRKPSIAVLPFANLSQEPDTDYFSYGLTEDVICLLARNRWLDVLSRHSAVAFQGKGTDPREIGAALGIRYLVQGTVVKHGERVRITADLVSAENGHHLWWEVVRRCASDILDVQNPWRSRSLRSLSPSWRAWNVKLPSVGRR